MINIPVHICVQIYLYVFISYSTWHMDAQFTVDQQTQMEKFCEVIDYLTITLQI